MGIVMKKLTEEQIARMKREAGNWMMDMHIDDNVIIDFCMDDKLHKIYVNHEKRSLMDEELTEEEIRNIKEVEEKYNILVYYVIRDEGMWPDGVRFPRYTYLYVTSYEEDWEMYRNGITETNFIPAYVQNLDEPAYSELTEILFRCIKGMIMNAS